MKIAVLARIAAWLVAWVVEHESKQNLTRYNARAVRTRMIEAIAARMQRAVQKTPDFKADDDFWQFAAWVMDGEQETHRLQAITDGVRAGNYAKRKQA